MPVISPQDHITHAIPGVSFRTLASPSLGSSETSVWRLRMAPNTPPVPHRLTREEIFVALSGTATARLDGETAHLEAGSALVVPPHLEFELTTGAQPFDALVCLPVGGQGIVGEDEPFTPPWAA